jgi:hypothetical protein
MKPSSLFLGLLGTALIFIALTGTAETVIVKYRGPVDLSHFDCEQITRSSVVKRLCYDSAEKYVIVNLTGTYYHYCKCLQPRSPLGGRLSRWEGSTTRR